MNLFPLIVTSVSIFTVPVSSLDVGNDTPGTLFESRTLPKSSVGALHNLLHLSSNSTSMAPVARSYDGNDWEISPGRFSSISMICESEECILQLPLLGDDEEYAVYESSHTLPRKDEVARFLEQTTFGTTLAEINSFDSTTDLNALFATYIDDQMHNQPISLHRTYFRERAVYHLNWPHPIARPYHPCEADTRYRRYAFTGKDKNRRLQVKAVNGKYLLSVDGEPRTMVTSIDWSSSAYKNSKGSMPTTDHAYLICSEPGEEIYGGVVVRDYRTNQCQTIKVNNQGGNAMVDFAGFTEVLTDMLTQEGNNYNYTMANYLTLTSSDAISINDVFFNSPKPQNFKLKQDLSYDACAAVSQELNLIHYVAYYQPNNIWLLHTPPPKLIQNTIDSPAIDGGGYNANWSKGRTWCANAPRTFLNEDKCVMSNDENVCSHSGLSSKPLMVCGSSGEITSNPNSEGPRDRAIFDVAFRQWRTTGDPAFGMYRKTVWLNNVLSANDQLRQRMAWALSQILVISSPSIVAKLHSEPFLNYYDILVRNAFGNYFHVLKEIAFNPEMAENLSFLNSQSSAYMLENNLGLGYPDENFAREVMQLFSIGFCNLNPDGTLVTDDSTTAKCIETYDNEEIIEYSRAWTGFIYNTPRGNMESQTDRNHIDPMDINPKARDLFPKLGLNAEYIGDKYPLCTDQPEYHFLKKGAKYRLLGGVSLGELQKDPTSWDSDESAVKMTLSSASSLYEKLCNYQESTASCDFSSVVVLDSHLTCEDSECDVDTVRVVEVTAGIFYEYVSQPCVEQAFYSQAKTTVVKDTGKEFCTDPRSQVASTACCASGSEVAVRNEKYWGERLSYESAQERCQLLGLSLCESPSISDCTGNDCDPDVSYWTSTPCSLKVKVLSDNGKVAIIHDTSNPPMHVASDTTVTFFNVNWQNGYPTSANNCGDCEVVQDDCICPVYVENTAVFTSMPSSPDEIMSKLSVGAFEPSALGYAYFERVETDATRKHGDYIMHQPTKDDDLNLDTIFEVTTDYGVTLFLKNVKSTVNLMGSSSYFPNPPQFMKLADITKRDALHETDATLKQYFYHDNTAPFLVTRLIQRFGISNPSPGYVLRVATAFRTGTFIQGAQMFGTMEYGDLASTVAAILLDPEARNVLLDADPSFGSVREPLLKAISLFRTFDVITWKKHPLIQTRLMALTDQLSEEPFEAQSVFSYYLPEFSSPGAVNSASLVAPEAQLLTGPNVNGLMNGIFSMIKYGIHSAHGGLFHQNCGRHNVDPGDYRCSKGHLQYSPTATTSDGIVDELAMLMTSGRLSAESRQVAKNVYDNESRKVQAIMMVTQIIASSPEFQTTGLVKAGTESRVAPQQPTQSSEPYKAVVFLFLDGGMDSYNMLVPTCDPLKTNYLQKRQSAALSENDLLSISTPPETNQTCDNFGLHKKFTNLHTRYNSGQVLFFANVGTITEAISRNTIWKEKSVLFAHNRMREEVQRLDPFDQAPALGIIGRITDALSQLTGATSGSKYQIGSYSINGIKTALSGTKGKSPNQIIIGKNGPTKFDPSPWSSRSRYRSFDLIPHIYAVNKIPAVESNVFGSTWSSDFLDIIEENDILDNLFSSARVVKRFAETKISMQLMQVAKLINIRDARGVDRDFFYVSMGGWDHHQDMKAHLDEMFPILDSAIETFWDEMETREMQNNVVLVGLSEFGRSLAPNGGSGTDHGWGGNYWIMGGDVNGGRILGKYPDSFDGDLDAGGRGRIIPTTPWDAVWNGIAQWMGVNDETLLREILPNAKWDDSKFTKEDLFT